MFKLFLILLLLVSACVTIHGLGMMLGLHWLSRAWPRSEHSFSLPRLFRILIRVVFGLLLLHLLQIAVWAAFYDLSGCFPDFNTSFYFSATSYSTVGYGDVVLPTTWRVFGPMEAVTGVLMFGWSTGVLFAVVNRLQTHFFKGAATVPPDSAP
ncbi:MAG: potassium channel family protein [Verrucomicrobia bacterium]|nr:potassium channel family protein [Verrucomicrobiota bacterium]